MVPQLTQGFLQPQASLGTGKPQRLHSSGEAGKRGGAEVERAAKGEYFSASPLPTRPGGTHPALPKPVRSGQERIGESLDADRGVRAVAAMEDGRVRQ
jgi:hypothetical protein